MLTSIMGTIGFCFCFIFFIKNNLVTGQYLPQEKLLNLTTCDLKIVNLNCDNDDMIAFQSAHFYYYPTCESKCCSYSIVHDTLEATPHDIVSIRRVCSGQNSCNFDVDGIRIFASGGKSPSYAELSYHCIPKSRTASICSTKKLTSRGSLLYLTNEDFPLVTTDHRSCSCSLEVYSCTSGVYMYLVDADMYLDEANCQQGINIFDRKNASVLDVTCASYYTNEISKSSFTTTNYIRIDFTDNSAAKQEGIFFIGFGATEPNVAFKLSCAAEQPTTCIDCGYPNSIPNSKSISLNNGTSSGSQATVTCSSGYETDNATLICLETGQWTTTTCSPKDCGELYTILNGTLTAAVVGSTTFGAKANLACDPGYQVTGYCNRITEFQCGDGTCINYSSRCDNFPDCPDLLDELSCEKVIFCLEGQKLCDVTCVNEQVTCEESETSVAEPDTGTISCLVIGKWEKVRCSAKDCGTPTDIDNGNITLTEDGKTTYMSTADVTCNTDYTPSIALIVCQADGTWENGTCNIIDCGVASVPNGTVTLTNQGESTFGSTAKIECSAGFTSSVSSVTCLVNGQWEDASCDINDCATPTDIDKGNITLTEDGKTTYMSTAVITCDTGYTPTIALIVCQADGTWENSTCNNIDCGEPYTILHGTVSTLISGVTSLGARAIVTCDQGYQVKKNGISCPEAVTCEDGGSSETETEARIISCLEIGKWESVQCLLKDTAQKETGNSSTILVIILACLLTAALSVALTLIVLFVVRKYKRLKPNTLTPPPEHDVYYNTEQSLDNNEGDSHQYERLNEISASGTTYSTLDVNDSTNQ